MLVKQESKQSCPTTRAPHWLLSHMQRSEQELQQQDKKINNLLKGIYEVLSKGKTTYGVAGDREDRDGKSDSVAEDAIKKATGNDQIAEQIKAIPSDDSRVQAYEELLKIYKDDSSSDYAKKGALGELQAAMIVAGKLNDNVLKMVNFTNAYKDLVTYCKEHTVDSDKQEVAKLLVNIYLPVHVNKAILGRITGAEGGSDLDVLRSQLIEKLQNGDQEQVEESLEQLVLTANFGPELLEDMEKYKDSQDWDFISFSTAYSNVINNFGARYGGYISGRDQQTNMKALFKATIDMYTKLGQDDLVERAKDLATAYEKNID